MVDKTKIRVCVSLSDEHKRFIDIIARDKGLSRSEIIRSILDNSLEEYNKEGYYDSIELQEIAIDKKVIRVETGLKNSFKEDTYQFRCIRRITYDLYYGTTKDKLLSRIGKDIHLKRYYSYEDFVFLSKLEDIIKCNKAEELYSLILKDANLNSLKINMKVRNDYYECKKRIKESIYRILV